MNLTLAKAINAGKSKAWSAVKQLWPIVLGIVIAFIAVMTRKAGTQSRTDTQRSASDVSKDIAVEDAKQANKTVVQAQQKVVQNASSKPVQKANDDLRSVIDDFNNGV